MRALRQRRGRMTNVFFKKGLFDCFITKGCPAGGLESFIEAVSSKLMLQKEAKRSRIHQLDKNPSLKATSEQLTTKPALLCVVGD